jgi:putative spermidine/putrescine transport system permease protein
LAFLIGWSDYVVTLVLGAGQLVTLPLLLGASASGSGNDPTTAALSLLAVAPPLALLVVATGLSRRRARR